MIFWYLAGILCFHLLLWFWKYNQICPCCLWSVPGLGPVPLQFSASGPHKPLSRTRSEPLPQSPRALHPHLQHSTQYLERLKQQTHLSKVHISMLEDRDNTHFCHFGIKSDKLFVVRIEKSMKSDLFCQTSSKPHSYLIWNPILINAHHLSLWKENVGFIRISVRVLQLMSKSSEKPRLRQIPSEDMDSEEVGPSAGDAHQGRVRAESQRELESQEEQLNLQHTLILNQVRHKPPILKLTYMRRTRRTCFTAQKGLPKHYYTKYRSNLIITYVMSQKHFERSLVCATRLDLKRYILHK